MKNQNWLKIAYFGTGADTGFTIHYLSLYIHMGTGLDELLFTAGITITGIMSIVLLEIREKVSKPMEEEIGLDLEEDFSTDAEYQCSYCGDPVKKGDRVLKDGETYCTREHAEEDQE